MAGRKHTVRKQGPRTGAPAQKSGSHMKPPAVGKRDSMPAHGGKKGS